MTDAVDAVVATEQKSKKKTKGGDVKTDKKKKKSKLTESIEERETTVEIPVEKHKTLENETDEKSKKRTKDGEIKSEKKKKKSKRTESVEEMETISETPVKKRKAEKVDKKAKRLKTQENETDESEGKKHPDDHVPTEIGEVDTDILQQASVNLGLPMADKAAEDPSSATEKSKKKKKKKKERENKPKKGDGEGKEEDKNPDSCALKYLRLWHSDRESWKFNKHLQVRLMRNVYEQSKLADEDFEVLLLYLDGMQGKSREKTRDDAGKIVKEESGDDATQERARQIFQMLS